MESTHKSVTMVSGDLILP